MEKILIMIKNAISGFSVSNLEKVEGFTAKQWV